ncbi:hypothetical protein DE4585_00345 [Mycobacteroides salmoniphilum]|uniref:Helix-turn-helix domain protein n=1 Tax=Mycobacteroides salmoniphilum TaxID=404941 RepID=A0A4R8S8Q1_9MYCO|nr:helix-turn-helix domain-containing protein [Mycobacteroides salmoniphilum]TDZ87353.1 hypothetical protein DE4585_00345 [Mycobacteroides salmoniphilum]
MTFSKLAWMEAVRLDTWLTIAQRLIIIHIGSCADKYGVNAWKSNADAAKELGVTVKTVKRARRDASVRGFWVVTKPGRTAGQGMGYTTVYRLTMPAFNGVTADPIKDETPDFDGDCGVPLKDNLTGTVESIDGDSGVHCGGLGNTPHSGIYSGIYSGESRAREEPLDVTAVPEPSDGLSPSDLLDQENIFDGELVEIDDDPEPQYGCDAHPLGHGKPCPACGIARHNYKRWEERNPDRIAARLLGAAQLFDTLTDPPPPTERVRRPCCPYCQDTDFIILSDGTPGSEPMWCNCDGTRRPATPDEIDAYNRRRTA